MTWPFIHNSQALFNRRVINHCNQSYILSYHQSILYYGIFDLPSFLVNIIVWVNKYLLHMNFSTTNPLGKCAILDKLLHTLKSFGPFQFDYILCVSLIATFSMISSFHSYKDMFGSFIHTRAKVIIIVVRVDFTTKLNSSCSL